MMMGPRITMQKWRRMQLISPNRCAPNVGTTLQYRVVKGETNEINTGMEKMSIAKCKHITRYLQLIL